LSAGVRAARTFKHPVFAEAASMRLLRRVLVPFLVLWACSALWSGFRAVVQVFDAELHVPSSVVRDGSTIGYDVTSSGRVTVGITLELLQGSQRVLVANDDVRTSRDAALDPRPKHRAGSVTVASRVLDSLQPGPARVRLTVLGRSQWLRTPPPTIREVAVTIQRSTH
jgi:hypothetical protein